MRFRQRDRAIVEHGIDQQLKEKWHFATITSEKRQGRGQASSSAGT
jgi:hypothetical protein